MARPFDLSRADHFARLMAGARKSRSLPGHFFNAAKLPGLHPGATYGDIPRVALLDRLRPLHQGRFSPKKTGFSISRVLVLPPPDDDFGPNIHPAQRSEAFAANVDTANILWLFF